MKQNNSTKQPKGTRIADQKKLQEIMHYHGLKEFQQLLRNAYFDASEEMKELNTIISEEYRELANKIEIE